MAAKTRKADTAKEVERKLYARLGVNPPIAQGGEQSPTGSGTPTSGDNKSTDDNKQKKKKKKGDSGGDRGGKNNDGKDSGSTGAEGGGNMKWLVNFALAVVASVCAIGAYQYYTTDMQPLRQQLLLVDTEARKVVDLSREETKRLQILRGGQPTAAPSVSALTATPSPGANEYDRCVLVKTKNVYRLAPGDCYIFDDVDGDFSKPSSVIGGVNTMYGLERVVAQKGSYTLVVLKVEEGQLKHAAPMCDSKTSPDNCARWLNPVCDSKTSPDNCARLLKQDGHYAHEAGRDFPRFNQVLVSPGSRVVIVAKRA
jgi:hypothetical protein